MHIRNPRKDISKLIPTKDVGPHDAKRNQKPFRIMGITKHNIASKMRIQVGHEPRTLGRFARSINPNPETLERIGRLLTLVVIHKSIGCVKIQLRRHEIILRMRNNFSFTSPITFSHNPVEVTIGLKNTSLGTKLAKDLVLKWI